LIEIKWIGEVTDLLLKSSVAEKHHSSMKIVTC